jgi:hypothetical protein
MLGDTPMARDTLARLADTGTSVLDVEVLRLRPGSRMDDALRILDAGARLQARGVLVSCNDPEEDRLVERFAAVCEAVGARGLRACLEFMIFSSVKTIADAQRVLNRTGHPAGTVAGRGAARRQPGRNDGRRAYPPGLCGPHRVAGQGHAR